MLYFWHRTQIAARRLYSLSWQLTTLAYLMFLFETLATRNWDNSWLCQQFLFLFLRQKKLKLCKTFD
jgi:hypothetical protein